jgi:tetratricopeptide (TPR) repeat protein
VNAIVWLLKIAATMMIVGTTVVDLAVLVAWLGYGLVEESQSKFPLWIVLVTALISFLNVLLSSFLFGVAGQVATNSGAEKRQLPLDDKLSDTIDEGWPISLKLARWTLLFAMVILLGAIAFFFNDLKFISGFHKGMELNAHGNPVDAEKWFRLSVESAGPDRIAIARFLLAGSLIRSRKYPQAEVELNQILKELDEKNDEHQSLLVYVYSALSNCYMFQNRFPEAELWTKKAIKVIEDHPQMLGLRLRLIGTYRQFLIPEAPPLAVAMSGLNDVYMLEKKPELAFATFKQILGVLSKQPHLTENDIFFELRRFENQLKRMPVESVGNELSAAELESQALAARKCGIKDAGQFKAEFSRYISSQLPVNK